MEPPSYITSTNPEGIYTGALAIATVVTVVTMSDEPAPAEPSGPSEVDKRIDALAKRKILEKLESALGCKIPIDFEMLDHARNASRQMMVNHCLEVEMTKALFVEKFGGAELEAYVANADISGTHLFNYFDVLIEGLLQMLLLDQIEEAPADAVTEEKEQTVETSAKEVPTAEAPAPEPGPEPATPAPPRAEPVVPAAEPEPTDRDDAVSPG